MTPTVLTLDQVTGTADFAGIRVTALGDDGEILLALGHHHPDRAVTAFDAAAHRLGWGSLLDGGNFTTRAEATAAVQQRWARFTTGCEEGCTRPDEPGHWWADYVDQAEPGAVPVTTIDCGS